MTTKILCLVFTAVFCYLLGSVNSAITVCKLLKGKDIREYGSNNAGLTNVLRVFGKGPALATLLCDLAKGVVGVVICRIIVTRVVGVVFFDDKLFIGFYIGGDRTGAHVAVVTKDRVADIVIMRRLDMIKQDDVLQLHGIADDAVRTYQR